MDKYREMKKVKDEVVACQKCPLHKTRNLPVIGEGSHDAKVMFVGEGPGANEDKTGRPFCGAAGRVLDELLGSVGIPRKDVYISNIIKCRPPGNRDPLKEEIQACTPYLERQIAAIKPKVLCPLGRHSMYFVMEKFGLSKKIQPISKIHGQTFEAKNLFGNITIIPFFHPAVVTYNANMMSTLKKDFEVLKQYS